MPDLQRIFGLRIKLGPPSGSLPKHTKSFNVCSLWNIITGAGTPLVYIVLTLHGNATEAFTFAVQYE
jgi:hypothetical protein